MTHAEIRSLAEQALVDAEKHFRSIGDRAGVNWADISVIDVVWAVNEEGERFWMVYFAEASPDAYEFRRYIRSHKLLKDLEVEVITEW